MLHEHAQNWRLHLDKTDSSVAFENVHWPGYYLGANHDDDSWLELRSRKKIKWTANSTSAHVPDDSSEISESDNSSDY